MTNSILVIEYIHISQHFMHVPATHRTSPEQPTDEHKASDMEVVLYDQGR